MLAALAVTALGATYDPELTWRVIETEHFELHFHQGEEQLADEVAAHLEDVYVTMTAELRWEPRRRTQVVLLDRTDSANGFAGTTPYNAIVLFATAPQEDGTLGFYEDWSPTIATHEFTHILHLDTNHGIVRLTRVLVGKVASTNSLSPWWMVEGLATFEETRHTTGGRGRSEAVRAVLRTAYVEDAWPPLGNLDGFQIAPPGGNLRYLFGSDFIAYVADHHGYDSWTKWTHRYGSGLPWLLPGKEVFGKGLPWLYQDWRAARAAEFAEEIARVEAEGLREGDLVSDDDATCVAPSFSPDGTKIVWSCLDLREGAAILLADRDAKDPEVILANLGARNFTWRSDSEAFVYAATHVVNRFNTWSDVFLHTLGDDGVVALTTGKRARDPEFSPDGSRLYVVTNAVQDNQLGVMTVDRRLESLTDLHDHTQFSTPRVSPDGRAVALSVWADGRRDLWLYDTDGKPLRRLTADVAIDRDPEWSADGKWLYFSSDRGGIPNIYAIEVATERLVQWTNVRTAATSPTVSPDGHWLVFQHYSANGWEIHRLDQLLTTPIERGTLPASLDGAPLASLVGGPPVLPLSRAAWTGEPERMRPGGEFVPPDPVATTWNGPAQSSEGIDMFEQAKVDDLFGEEKDYPFKITPRRYHATQTLTPRFWLPIINTTPYDAERFEWIPKHVDEQGRPDRFQALQLGAYTGGTDVLRFASWTANVSYRNDADLLLGSGQITWNRYLPVYQLGASRSAYTSGGIPVYSGEIDDEGNPEVVRSDERYWQSREQAFFQVSYPYTYRSTVFGRYAMTVRQDRDELPDDVALGSVPARGYVGELSGGWRYVWGRSTPYSISPEDARTVSFVGGLRHPYLGTWLLADEGGYEPFTQLQATGELRQYVTNPWVPNHVLAFRLGAGGTLGPTDFFGSYQLGGVYGDSGFATTPDELRMVRGYATGVDIGDMYWLASAEYRLPIVRIDRGWGVIPAFLRYVSAAAFVDTGNAFVEFQGLPDAVDGTLFGAGAEVRASALVGWSLPITMRAGCAVGLTGEGAISAKPLDGEDGPYPNGFPCYLQGGTSF
jgi:hypothetical protein